MSIDVAARNDRLRKTGLGGRTMISELVVDLDYFDDVMGAMISFDAFDRENDPHEEHDCAVFEVRGEQFMFKIDYYDLNLEYGVCPKTEPAIHVLTLMHASER